MGTPFTRGPGLWALATVVSLLATVLLPGIMARGQQGFDGIGTVVFVVLIGGILSLVFALSAAVSGWRRRGTPEAVPGRYTWGPLLLCLVCGLLFIQFARMKNKETTASPTPRTPTVVTEPADR